MAAWIRAAQRTYQQPRVPATRQRPGAHQVPAGCLPGAEPPYLDAGVLCRAAISRAVAESGPGWGTNTASR